MIKRSKGITLIALVVTIIILAGVTIASLEGENGLITKVNQAKKAQIKAEMKEQLILALTDLQLEKAGKATLDDITQEWIDEEIKDYECIITEDASIAGKKVTMKKNNITGKYIIDEKLNIIEIEENESSIELTYEVKGRDGENLEVLVTITDNANGLQQVEYLKDGHIEQCNGKKSVSRDCIIQLGEEYKVQITSKSGEEKTETILINDYYHTITKNLGEGISIDNQAIKAAYNKAYQATIIADDEYIIDTITVTMGGQKIEVDKSTGVINIEKVTGDIEITATARKLEIHMTDPIIGTSTTSTSSVADNSQIRGTTLYINFSATLEGQNCTITYKEDETKTVPFAITKNGKYVFIVKGIYSGKTIEEEKEVEVNKYKSPSGIVQYDAGEWTQEEIAELQSKSLYDLNYNRQYNQKYKLNDSEGLVYTFGGFTYKGSSDANINGVITSRNQSVSPAQGYGTPYYNGWQLMKTETKEDANGSVIKNSDGTDRIYVKSIIHAGSPENFVYNA